MIQRRTVAVATLLFFWALGLPVAAQVATTPSEEEQQGGPTTMTTLLASAAAGLTAAIVTVLGQGLLGRMTERRRERLDSRAVYKTYADPIFRAAVSLFRRLDEVAVGDLTRAAAYFGNSETAATPFDQYKFNSTLYRLAAVVGWLRAYRRELHYFPSSDPKNLRGLSREIAFFESALADGAHVELDRLERVCQAMGMSLPTEDKEQERKAVLVDQALNRALHAGGVDVATELEPEQRAILCREVAGVLSAAAVVDQLDCRSIVSALAVREAWLYRDYQAGIGDLMLRETTGGPRRFDVIGFGEFEELLGTEDQSKRVWMLRLRSLFEGLELGDGVDSDARVVMLRKTHEATGRMLHELMRLDSDRRASSAKEVVQKIDEIAAKERTDAGRE